MENLEEHGYKVINERLKVRYLIACIKYGALNSAKAKILASAPYRQDYDASVILYKYYIKQAQDTNSKLNISGVGTGAGESPGEGAFTGKIEDKYYKTAIYKKLSKSQREEHSALRNKCKQKAGNDVGRDSCGTYQLTKLKMKV